MEAKQQTGELNQSTTVLGTNPLAVVPQTSAGQLTSITEIVWTQERIDLIKRVKCPPDTTNDEFAIFLMQCKRTGMDPLIDEADCVPRWKKVKVKKPGTNGREYYEEQMVETKVFQPREAGMRARADRFPDYRGIKYGTVREGDKFNFDPSNHLVEHSFNPADPARSKKPIMGAWAQIKREGRLCVPVWLPLSERIQVKNDGGVTQMWNTKTETMIAKCARAEAYRIEYPNVFAGQFIVEEWEQEDERELNQAPSSGPGPGDAPAAKPTKTDQVLQQVKDKLDKITEKKAAPEDATIVQPPAQPVTPAAATKPAPTPPKAETKGKKRQAGTYKGLVIAHFDATSLSTAIAATEKFIAEKPMAPESTEARACLEDLQQEQAKRIAASLEQGAREPGSDDANLDEPF